MWVGDQGELWTYINSPHGEGQSYKPNYRDSGKTHQGLGQAGVRDHVKLGRIYGTGRLDVSF